MNGAFVDRFLTALRGRGARQHGVQAPGTRSVPTHAGQLRVLDTGGRKPVRVLTPDGPCVIEHPLEMIKRFSAPFRVICFAMPGHGFSFPRYGYRLRLTDAVEAIVELLDPLSVAKAAVAFTCANGFVAPAVFAAQRLVR